MKKNIILSMVGVAAAGLLLTSCSGKPESVTAVVAGPDGQPAAVVVKYAKAVSAESVSADAFQVEGQEIETVFVTDKDITTPPAKPEERWPAPDGREQTEGYGPQPVPAQFPLRGWEPPP